jgi:outer membrane immunogenic protein
MPWRRGNSVMRKAVVLACIAGLSGIDRGFAADLGPAPRLVQRQPSPVMPGWAGPYIGVQAGYLAGRGDISFPGTGEFHFVDPNGFAGGVMGGYAMQWGRIVGGLEGDVSFLNARGTTDTGFAPDPAVTQLQTSMHWNGHIRGRFGYAFDQAMFFVAGGLALAGVEDKAIDNGAGVTATWNDIRAGWSLGGGVDYRVAPAATVRLEYLYDNYGSQTLAAQTVSGVTFAERDRKLDTHTFRAGVNWRF